MKYFFIGAMPELMSRRLLSLLGTSEKLLRRKCPLLSKKDKYDYCVVNEDVTAAAKRILEIIDAEKEVFL